MPPTTTSPSPPLSPDAWPGAMGSWRTWLSIGATGFGGPAAQVAILHRELVERRRWLDEEEFLAAMRVCMLLPGPEAQQLATYAGWRLGGLPGGLLAGTLFVLPGAALVTALAWLHAASGTWPAVAAAFAGTRPAVVALVALAAWRIGRKSLRSPAAVVLAIVALCLLAGGIGFPLVVLAAGLFSFVATLLMRPPAPPSSGQPPADGASEARLVIAAPGRATHVPLTLLAWTALWAAAFAAVSLFHVAGGRGAEIAKLFTETTLLSLGGAYAVVPWALEESVARGWLHSTERFDGLAMGEATPGPLILVVTFIGFLAGWKTTVPGDAAAGLAGGAVATLFAFIPSFAMILTVAPFVRGVRAGSRLGRAMAAIGAVVVAAIVLLGLRLAAESFLPAGQFDPVAVIVAGACAAALLSGRMSAPVVVVAASGLGLLGALLTGKL